MKRAAQLALLGVLLTFIVSGIGFGQSKAPPTQLPSLTVSPGGITAQAGSSVIANLTTISYLVSGHIIYNRGPVASTYLTNDNGTDPLFVNDLQGLCVGDLTGTECDGELKAVGLGIGNNGSATQGVSASGANTSVRANAATVFLSNNSVNMVDASGTRVLFNVRRADAVQSVTVADDGAGTATASTLTPSTSYVSYTCNDANGCAITLSETGAVDGVTVRVTNVSANAVNFADTAGVSELAGAFAMGQHDSITLLYATDRWVELSRSNN